MKVKFEQYPNTSIPLDQIWEDEYFTALFCAGCPGLEWEANGMGCPLEPWDEHCVRADLTRAVDGVLDDAEREVLRLLSAWGCLRAWR